jgi:hypothetical protein
VIHVLVSQQRMQLHLVQVLRNVEREMRIPGRGAYEQQSDITHLVYSRDRKRPYLSTFYG